MRSVLFLAYVTIVSGLPTSLRTVTLFTEKRSWNEARFICETFGAELAFIKDEQTSNLFKALTDQEPWTSLLSSFSSYYIGLFNNAGTDPAQWLWLDCDPLESFTDWGSASEPMSASSRMCIYATGISGYQWSTRKCDDESSYVCEVIGGNCSYDVVSDSRAVDLSPYLVGSVSVEECQVLCDTFIYQEQECWGFTWSTEKCELHFAADWAYFSDTSNIETSNSDTFYKKICTLALVNDSVIPSFDFISSTPFSDCQGAGGIGTEVGNVYTLHTVNATWHEAMDICQRTKQQLVVLDSSADELVLEDFYTASFWMGLNGSNSTDYKWIDNSSLTWHSFPGAIPGNGETPLCVADSAATEWSAHNCSEMRPFVCQKQGRCMYTQVKHTRGTDYTVESSETACEEQCEATTDCIGYSYVWFLRAYCRIHVGVDLFDPVNYESKLGWTLYRLTCNSGFVVGEIPYVPEPIQGMNVTGGIPGTDPEVISSSEVVSSVLVEISSLPIDMTITESPSPSVAVETWSSEHIWSSPIIDTSSSVFSHVVSASSYVISVFETSLPNASPVKSSSSDVLVGSSSEIIKGTPIASSFQGSVYSEGTSDQQTVPLNILTTLQIIQSSREVSSQQTVQQVVPSSTNFVPQSQSVEVSSVSVAMTSQQISNQQIVQSSMHVSSQQTVQQVASSSTSLAPQSQPVEVSSASVSTPKPTPSSTGSAALTTSSTYPCPCKCHLKLTQNETQKLVQEIRERLLLEKEELSSETRKKTSASDHRESSQGMGYVAIVFLSLVFGFMLLADVGIIYTHSKLLMRNIADLGKA